VHQRFARQLAEQRKEVTTLKQQFEVHTPENTHTVSRPTAVTRTRATWTTDQPSVFCDPHCSAVYSQARPIILCEPPGYTLP
jgi:hypothetical protein